jgi:hypothetical protein
MRLARVLMLAPALATLIGCAGDKTPNATWRHSDGSPLDPVELAQSRAACDRTVPRADLQQPPPIASNPAYHPGGIGLESTQATAGFGGPSGALPNASPAFAEDAARLEACLEAKGIVRGP